VFENRLINSGKIYSRFEYFPTVSFVCLIFLIDTNLPRGELKISLLLVSLIV